MAITAAGVKAGSVQRLNFLGGEGSATTIGNLIASHLGSAGAAVPAIPFDMGSLASGVVPEGGANGFPTIRRDGTHLVIGGYTGITNSPYAGQPRFLLLDVLFYLGAIAYNAAPITLANAPTFADRVSAQGGYNECRLYMMQSSAGLSGNPTATVTYTNQSGVTGRTATLAWTSSTQTNLTRPFPLQSGDSGVQAIEGVSMADGTAGSFAVFIARPLFHSGMECGVATSSPTVSNTPTAKLGVRFPEAGVIELLGNPALMMLTIGINSSFGVSFNTGVQDVELVSL